VVGRAPGRATVSATLDGVRGWAVVTVVAPVDTGVFVAAHRGYRLLFPENTLVAIDSALARGADAAEVDVYVTRDSALMLMHDATVDRTTNGTGRVDQMTLAQIKALDAAYWFVPGCGTCHGRADAEYTLRGYATGARKLKGDMKKQFSPNDFRIPTLREALETFPDRLINIEIKNTAPQTVPYEQELAALLSEYGRTTDTIVVSFTDNATETFKLFAPEVSTAVGTGEAAAFWTSSQGPLPGAPNPRHHALQVPIELNGLTVVTPDFVRRAHANGLAVHVWTINDRAQMEALVAMGVDGIMTDRPTLLEDVLEG